MENEMKEYQKFRDKEYPVLDTYSPTARKMLARVTAQERSAAGLSEYLEGLNKTDNHYQEKHNQYTERLAQAKEELAAARDELEQVLGLELEVPDDMLWD